MFLNCSTCFERHTAHHQELKNCNCSHQVYTVFLPTNIPIGRNVDGDITKEFPQIAICITGPSYKSFCDTVHANVINDLLQPKMAAFLSAKNKYPPLPTSTRCVQKVRALGSSKIQIKLFWNGDVVTLEVLSPWQKALGPTLLPFLKAVLHVLLCQFL